jgi:hypothetical protein
MPAYRQRRKVLRLPRETLINCLSGRIASLCGARNLNIFMYMPRFLRSVRLALHPAQTINQRFPKEMLIKYIIWKHRAFSPGETLINSVFVRIQKVCSKSKLYVIY